MMPAYFKTLRTANHARHREWLAGAPPTPRPPWCVRLARWFLHAPAPEAPPLFGLSFRGNELAGECGEACNIIKKLERERMGLIGSRATVAELADELVDVIQCVDLIAMDLDIDLWAALVRKFNAASERNGFHTRLQ